MTDRTSETVKKVPIRSRGVLEEVNRAAQEIEEDERELRAIRGGELESVRLAPAIMGTARSR
jgi:hypothetical protein